MEGPVASELADKLGVGQRTATAAVDEEQGPTGGRARSASRTSVRGDGADLALPRSAPRRPLHGGGLEEGAQGRLVTCCTRAVTRTASSEWPPSSKKLSWTPTRGTPSTSPRCAASSSSVGVARGDVARRRRPWPASGAGSALRSTLPLGVSGSASSTTKAEGTMYSGSRCCRQRAQRRGVERLLGARHDVGDQALVAGPSSRDHDHGLAHAGVRRRARPRPRPARCGSRAP